MQRRLGIGRIVLGIMIIAAAAMAAPSGHRLIVVVGQPSDPRVTQQQALLAQDAAALRERDVVEEDVTPEVVRHARAELGVGSGVTFQVLLVGKDGGVKLRRDRPVAASEITALIDAMPMRREEMRGKSEKRMSEPPPLSITKPTNLDR